MQESIIRWITWDYGIEWGLLYYSKHAQRQRLHTALLGVMIQALWYLCNSTKKCVTFMQQCLGRGGMFRPYTPSAATPLIYTLIL